jgi:hypothetical protein
VSVGVKSAIAVALLAVIGGALTAGWLYWVGGPEQLRDGQGALSAAGATHAFDEKNGPVWTIGLVVCVNQGFESAVLDGTVQGAAVIAGELTFVGARAGRVARGETIVDSVQGFPPQVETALGPAAGYVVTTPCDLKPNPSAAFTVFDFGVRSPAGHQGGGWNLIEIGYRVHGFHHVLTVDSSVYICGVQMPADVCSDPLPHAATP